MTTNSGFIIQPEIAIPAEATKINVSSDGIVSVQVPGQVDAPGSWSVTASRFSK